MKRPIIWCCLICCILCLSACAKKDARTVVEFASWGSKSEIDILKPVFSDFEKNNPDIKVDFMHIPQNYFQKVHLLFASNTAPDVIFINNLNLPIYANAGVLEDLGEYGVSTSDFYPQALKALSWKGKLYAVPRDVSNLVIYYNKSIFDSAKVPYPQQDWTFDEFLITAQKLTKHPDIFGVSFEEDVMYYLPFLMSEGGGILSDDLATKTISEANSQKGLNFYADLRKKYHVAPMRAESASATMGQMFLQGRLAMHLSGRWLVPKYRDEAKFGWDVVSFPHGGAGSVVPLDASGWAIAKSSKHKTEAMKLINYLSSRESVEKMAQSGLIVPARIDAANSKSFLDGKTPKHAQVFLDVIKTAKPTPVSLDYNVLNDKLKEKNERIFN